MFKRIKNLSLGKKVILISLALILVSIAAYFIRTAILRHDRDEACYAGIMAKLDSDIPPDSLFHMELDSLRKLVELSIATRSEMLKIGHRLEGNKDGPIPSRDLVLLKEGTEFCLELREHLYVLAEAYECTIDADDATLRELNISQDLRLKAVMLSLSSALTLFDNYMLGAILFQNDERLRNLLNDPDEGFGVTANRLQEVTLSAASLENRHRIRKAIKFVESHSERLSTEHEDSDFAYLSHLINNSPSYNYIRKLSLAKVALQKLDVFNKIGADWAKDLTGEGFDIMSGLFGNTVGMYEDRKGKLYGNEEVKKHLQAQLQPLDILLEKTPFRLTDKLIPGHFGHAAIWVGTKQELIDLDLWHHEVVQPHHEPLENVADPNSKNEQHIIEALRSGVEINSLEKFMNVDDVAILRPIFEDDPDGDLREALLLAFRQIGKEYDFNFDINTTDKIVCSELCYACYPTIKWPTEKTVGRYTISPDNVAQMCWEGVPLKLISFYHDGNLVAKAEQLHLLKKLMSGD